MENVYLTNMFPDYVPPEELTTALSQAAIAAADIDPENRTVSVAVHSQQYIPQRLLDQLDPLAEQDIYQKYNEMTKGRSSIYISHRLASTRFCSRIIMLEDGKIIEEGTHEQLLSLNQRYAELFEIQSKYYREGAETDEEI